LVRIAIGLEYDGTAYNGWQRQRTGIGVQALVEDALSSVANEDVRVTCAGRTDTGVHASGQVAHFDTESDRRPHGWVLGANSSLPDDINLTWAQPVDDSFHARFSATSRSYHYLILNRVQRSALYRDRAWCVHTDLDAERMHRAAQMLVGKHDFSAYRAAGCQASTPKREVTAISVSRDKDWLHLHVTANAFLQHMVRNVMGTLVAIGCGDKEEDWAGQVLGGKDRKRGGIAAPPHGLTLVGVAYPQEFQLPPDPNQKLR
jgi:tRNA pseudouridine38-40 synthase